ncbi:MAG: hypothetical protein AAB305_02570 [Candidatus Zixiibacteriota bacterium]
MAYWQSPLTAILFAFLILASSFAQATTTDEEEIVERDVQFSVPAEIADLQRTTADLKGYSFLAGASLYSGNDNNVHRSPDNLDSSSNTLGNWFYLRSDKRFGKNVQLINSLTWKHRSYADASAANLSRLYLSNWLDMRLSSHLKLALDFDVIDENDNATQITGRPYTRDYSYRRYSGDAMLTWSPGGPHRFQLGGETVRRDYGEIVGLNSIDWTSRGGTIRYRLRLAPYHYVKVWYTVGEKEYSDEPSSIANTEIDAPNSPMEKHRYRELRLAWEVPATKWMDASMEYFHRSKTDLYQGAESWDGNVWQAWIGIEASKRLEFTTEVGYFTQRFDQVRGDNNLPLETKRWDLQAGARFALTRSVRLFASTNYFERTSTRESGSVYRDYSGFSTAFGISFFFLTK